jgi:regulator of RNase E activity RraA
MWLFFTSSWATTEHLAQVFARDVGTAAPYGAVKVTAVNVPVELQSTVLKTAIEPGDFLIADLNGVVVLPKGLVEEVLPLMEEQAAIDSQMAIVLKDGVTFTEASRRFRG